jgi:hypothetical protein
LATAFPEYQGVRIPYVAQKKQCEDFFRQGIVTSTNVNAAGGG